MKKNIFILLFMVTMTSSYMSGCFNAGSKSSVTQELLAPYPGNDPGKSYHC